MTTPDPASSNLLSRLTAVVDEVALRALEAIQPSEMHPYGDRTLPRLSEQQIPDEVRGYLGGAWGEHFAMWPPDVALAHVAHARKVMERHTPETARDTEGCRRTGCCEDGCEVSYCGGCGYIGQDEDDLCPDLLDLVEAWGVTP